MTPRDLIKGSLRLIGAISNADTPAADEVNDALATLNDLLDSWSIEGLIVPNVVRETFTLVAGQGRYTIGRSGTPDFTTDRPIEVDSVLFQQVGSSPVVESDVEIYTQAQFAAISSKDQQASVPQYFYREGAYPNDAFNIWPVPSTAIVLVVYSQKPLSTITNLSATLSLPPGYQRALKFNLAKELAPEYGKSLSQEALDACTESKGNIKRQNAKDLLLETDAALVQSGGWNWDTG